MPSLLITGAGGYIGSRIAEDARALGHDLHLVDDFSEAQVKEVQDIPVKHFDIRNHSLSGHLRDVDCVLHLAAVSGVDSSLADPKRTFQVNVEGTRNVASACARNDTPLIFASSMAAVGKPAKFPIVESIPCHPINDYGRSKLQAEDAVRMTDGDDFRWIGFRITNVYGKHTVNGFTVTKESVVNKFLERAMEGLPLKVFSPGTQARDFISVRDVSSAFLKAASHLIKKPLTESQILNLGQGRWMSVLDLARLISTEAERNGLNAPNYRVVENPRAGKEILTDEYPVDVRGIKRVLGFQPHDNVEDYIGEAIRRSS